MGVFFASLIELNSLLKGNARMNGQLHNTVPECDIEKLKERYRCGTDIYIHTSSKDERAKILSILQDDGFEFDGWVYNCGNNPLESGFPLVINFERKTYRAMGNATCAACACSCKVVGSEKEFYYFYNKSKNRKGN